MAIPVSSGIGQNFQGIIKSYNVVTGYGFVQSDSLDGDLFFVHKNLSKEVSIKAASGAKLQGQKVEFTADMSDDGKALATTIKVLNNISYGKGNNQRSHDKFSAWDNWKSNEPSSKGGNNFKKQKAVDLTQPGEPQLNGDRVEGLVKSYSPESKWGFAKVDPSYGDFGDIFVHSTNLDSVLSEDGLLLREGDAIELNIENCEGKMVARGVSLIPQEASMFDGLWLKGVITSKAPGVKSGGSIYSPRLTEELQFSGEELPLSISKMGNNAVNMEVIFKVSTQVEWAATNINYFRLSNNLEREAQGRVNIIISELEANNYADPDCVRKLKMTRPEDFLQLLPDLYYINAENPSSFILGALSRSRKREKGSGRGSANTGNSGYGNYSGKGKGGWESKGKGNGGWESKGKGNGGWEKGGKRWGPYY